MLEIIGMYSCRKYNPDTNKFATIDNIFERCSECTLPIVDVRQVRSNKKITDMHEECIKVKFNVKDIKKYLTKICKEKNYKNNVYSAREMVEEMTFNNRLDLIKKIGLDNLKIKKSKGDFYCVLSKELLKIALDEGFNFYYDDLKEFYKEEVNG